MKFTKKQLKQIIQEEILKVIKEASLQSESAARAMLRTRKERGGSLGGAMAGFFGKKNKEFGDIVNGELYGLYLHAQDAGMKDPMTMVHWVDKWLIKRNEFVSKMGGHEIRRDAERVADWEEKDLLLIAKQYTTDGKQLKDFMQREHQLRGYLSWVEQAERHDRERVSREEKAAAQEEYEKWKVQYDKEASWKAARAAERAENEERIRRGEAEDDDDEMEWRGGDMRMRRRHRPKPLSESKITKKQLKQLIKEEVSALKVMRQGR